MTAKCALALSWGLLACTASETTHVNWPEVDAGELVFIAALNKGRLVTQRGPYLSGEQNAVVVKEFYREADELLHISVDPSALGALVPEFESARSEFLRLDTNSTDCPVSRSGSEARLAALDAVGAHVWRFNDDRFDEMPSPPSGVFIVIPPEATSCAEEETPRLTPFGQSEYVLAPGTMIGGGPVVPEDERAELRAGTALGQDHVVAQSLLVLFVFERGQAWRDDPRLSWPVSRLPSRPWPGGWRLRSWELDPVRSSPSSARILFVARWEESGDIIRSSVVAEIEWTPNGFGEPRILFESDEEHVRAVSPRPDGGFLVVGRDGLFLTGREWGDPVERRADLGLSGPLEAVTEGPTEGEPLVVLEGRRRLFFGDANGRRPFRVEEPATLVAGTLHIVDVPLRTGDKLFLMDEEAAGVTVRRPDGSQGRLSFNMPLDFAACASPFDACGNSQLAAGRTAMDATSRGSIVLAPSDCSAVLEVDANTGCARTLHMEGLSPTAEAPDIQRFVSERDGILTVVGMNGRILQARW